MAPLRVTAAAAGCPFPLPIVCCSGWLPTNPCSSSVFPRVVSVGRSARSRVATTFRFSLPYAITGVFEKESPRRHTSTSIRTRMLLRWLMACLLSLSYPISHLTSGVEQQAAHVCPHTFTYSRAVIVSSLGKFGFQVRKEAQYLVHRQYVVQEEVISPPSACMVLWLVIMPCSLHHIDITACLNCARSGMALNSQGET